MADQLDEILGKVSQAPSVGPVSVQSGAGVDELDTLLGKIAPSGTPAPAAVPAASGPALAPTEQDQAQVEHPPLDQVLGAVSPNRGYVSNLMEAFSGGVERNVAQFQAMPHALSSLASEYSGDHESAIASANKALEIDKAAGESKYEFLKIKSPEDFSYWLTEKLGENLATMGAMAFTGGAGALGGKFLAEEALKRAMISSVSATALRATAMTAGGYIGSIPLTTAMETAGTASELYGATDKIQPEWSVGAGVVKGALEAWGPMSMIRAMVMPNKVMGKTFAGATFKTMLKEGGTELAQEYVDIFARQHVDPEYSFFKAGATNIFEHPGVARLVEAGAAGFFTGGVYGAPAAYGESRKRGVTEDGKPEQLPGERATIKGDPNLKGTAEWENKLAAALKSSDLGLPEMEHGPITTLQQLVTTPDQTKDVRQATAVGRPEDDLMGLGPLLRLESKTPVEAKLLDMVDKETTRYVVRNPDGSYSGEVMTRTELELDNVVNQTQDVKPDYHKVDPRSLSAPAITARIHDIGKAGLEADMSRVWFVKGTTEQEKAGLTAEYQQLVKELTGTAATALENQAGYKVIEETFKPRYDELLKGGLRVIPTQGSGFYYSGPLAAERVNISQTDRDRMVGMYDKKNKRFSPFVNTLGNTFKLEDQANYARTLTAQWSGVPISLDLAKMKEGEDYTRTTRGYIILLKDIDLSKVTPGVDMGPLTQSTRGSLISDQAEDTLKATKPYYGLKRTGVNNKYRELKPYGPYIGLALDMERTLQKLAPVVDEVLRSLDLDFSMQLQITEQAPEYITSSPAWIWHGDAIIAFDPRNWANFAWKNNTGNLEVDIQTVLMHELGHMITGMYWQQMSLEQQDALIYAWEKANLARRMNPPSMKSFGDLRAMNPVVGQPMSAYYLKFSEWMAEQFRRFAETDPLITNWTEEAIKGGSKVLDQYYKRWEQRVGKEQAINLRRPDYFFTALMQYFRNFGIERTAFKNAMAQQELYYFSESIVENHVTFSIAKQVQAAIESMKATFPPKVSVLVSEQLEGAITAGAYAQTMRDVSTNLPYIELAFHALPAENALNEARVSITHELMHVLEMMKLITPDEVTILNQAIARGPDPLGKNAAEYARRYRSQLEDHFPPDVVALHVEKGLAMERRAFYLQQFANGEIARDEQSRTIMARLLEVLERIKNFIQGLGYQSRDDILRAIFRGEMARRSEEMTKAEWKNALRHSDPEGPLFRLEEYGFDRIDQMGNYQVGVAYDGGDQSSQEGKLRSKYISYIVFTADGKQVGFVDLKNRMPKGFEVEMIETKKSEGLLGLALNQHVEKDLGIPMKLSGILLEDGFKQGQLFARKRLGLKGDELRQFYQPVTRKDGTIQYFSPNKVMEMVTLWTRIVKMMQTKEGVALVNQQFKDMVAPGLLGGAELRDTMTQKRAIGILASWKAFEKRFPSEVWSSPVLDQMFQLGKNAALDGIQGASIREAQDETGRELLEALQGPQPKRGQTALEMYQAKMERYKAETATEMGWDPRDVGPPTIKTMYMLKAMKEGWSKVEGAWHEKAATHPKSLDKHLSGIVKNADRMNAFWKWYLTIKQLAQKNTHIAGLRNYVDHGDIMKQIMMKWVKRAEETARPWERLGHKEREAISAALFDLTEQKYRSPTEKQNKINRNPTGWQQFVAGAQATGETAAILRGAGVTKPASIKIIRRVAQDFADFLDEVEQLRITELGKTFAKDPATLQLAINKMQSEMAEFRAKPYFPMMRFGQFTMVVRDSQTGKIMAAFAYDNQAQRDKAFYDVQRQYPGEDITIGRASEAASEFMGLPGPLLRLIREKMNSDPATKLSQEQETWIQEFEVLNGPDTTFAKRWMPGEGTPGYSMDAFRAYSQYFMSGSRYIARLAKMDDLKAAILEVQQTYAKGELADTSKRQMIVDYMKAHYKYIMEPGQDAGKLRAFISLWFLGGSVTSAALNFMQIPTITIPYLTKQFGAVQSYGAFNTVINSLKNAKRLRYAQAGSGDPSFLRAREEAISQGIIDVGQAAELGAFAEGRNLHRLLAGDRTQKLWRDLSYYGMWMFSAVEHLNRELTFQMAWDLAMKNPNAERVSQIDQTYISQIADLQQRTGMSYKEAVTFLFAKETVERTQYDYDKNSDAAFMRGRKKDLLIFFKYTQNTLFTMTHNGSAGLHMLLLMFIIYGFQGLPGSEDLNELLRLLTKKLGGFDLHGKAREIVRDLTRGTIFDKTGPDLFLHGISRYGMGPGLFTEHYFPQFDVSANGSMGRIIPGLAELMHGFATDKKWADVFADSAQKASGAGYGMVFPLMKYLAEPPGTADSKKWEQLMPRFAKGFIKANRHAFENGIVDAAMNGYKPGAETDSTGAKLVGFDITDIGDALTVITTALGAQPRKVTEIYEMQRARKDIEDYYKARRILLYAQLDKAIKTGDVETQIDVQKAMGQFNKEMQDAGLPSESIKIQQVRQSLKQRETQRQMQEQFLARNKSQIPLTQKMMDLFPGIEPKKVK